jgi:hypothetical protein
MIAKYFYSAAIDKIILKVELCVVLKKKEVVIKGVAL